jgi:hypothetical protein
MAEPQNYGIQDGVSRRDVVLGGAGVTAAIVALSSLTTGCRRTKPVIAPDDALTPTDASLVKYREAGRVDVGVPDPAGIAVAPDGSLWAAGSGLVKRLAAAAGPDRSGRGALPEVAEIGGDATCLAATAGALFVGVGEHVEIVRANHARPEAWQPIAAEAMITCIAVGSKAVYLADSVARRIVRCDMRGRVLGYLAEKDPKRNYAGLIVPSPHLDVVVDEDDAVHIVNPGAHQIEIYDPDGSPRWSWGEESQDVHGFCGCCNPTDIALMPGGGYVTSEKGIPRVKLYSRMGHFEGVVAGHEDLSPGVVGLDLAVFPDGRIAVLDKGIKAVRIFEPKEVAHG